MNRALNEKLEAIKDALTEKALQSRSWPKVWEWAAHVRETARKIEQLTDKGQAKKMNSLIKELLIDTATVADAWMAPDRTPSKTVTSAMKYIKVKP